MIQPRGKAPPAHTIRTESSEEEKDQLDPDPYGLLHKHVLLTGESREVLNGRVGEVKQYDPTQGQYWVEFDDDTGLTLVKPGNLSIQLDHSQQRQLSHLLVQLHQQQWQWDRERGELEQWEHQFEEPENGPNTESQA